MNDSISIVYLLTFIDSQTGGMERQALQLAKRLRTQGHHIFFITCVHIDKMRREHLKIADTFYGFKIYRVPIICGWRRVNALIYFIGALIVLVLLKNHYTIIHAHQLNTSGLIACVLRLFLPSKKVIVKNCSGGKIGDINQIKKFPWHKKILRFMNKAVDTFIAVSNETAQEMRDVGLNSIVLIQNGVDTEFFVPLTLKEKEVLKKEILGDYVTQRVALFVGRLVPKKNVALLLEATAQLRLDILLLIVGDGPLRNELEKQAKNLGIQNVVFFLGAQKNVLHYYQIADIVILPSDNEGLPNVLLEAMSCGVPSLGSNIESIKAVIDHDINGYLFNYYSGDKVKNLTEKIRDIIMNNDKLVLFSENARRAIEKRFNLEQVVEKYLALYDKVF